MSTRDGIEQTLARYALSYDEADFEMLADCFADDCVLFFPTRGVAVRGRPAIAAQLEQQRRDRTTRDEQARHIITNLCFLEESADEALVVSFLTLTVTNAEGSTTRSGWYRDRMVNQAGTWRLRERTVFTDAGGEAKVSALNPPPIPAP
jgi:ketosteroid isomerase-like protein